MIEDHSWVCQHIRDIKLSTNIPYEDPLAFVGGTEPELSACGLRGGAALPSSLSTRPQYTLQNSFPNSNLASPLGDCTALTSFTQIAATFSPGKNIRHISRSVGLLQGTTIRSGESRRWLLTKLTGLRRGSFQLRGRRSWISAPPPLKRELKRLAIMESVSQIAD